MNIITTKELFDFVVFIPLFAFIYFIVSRSLFKKIQEKNEAMEMDYKNKEIGHQELKHRINDYLEQIRLLKLELEKKHLEYDYLAINLETTLRSKLDVLDKELIKNIKNQQHPKIDEDTINVIVKNLYLILKQDIFRGKKDGE